MNNATISEKYFKIFLDIFIIVPKCNAKIVFRVSPKLAFDMDWEFLHILMSNFIIEKMPNTTGKFINYFFLVYTMKITFKSLRK